MASHSYVSWKQVVVDAEQPSASPPTRSLLEDQLGHSLDFDRVDEEWKGFPEWEKTEVEHPNPTRLDAVHRHAQGGKALNLRMLAAGDLSDERLRQTGYVDSPKLQRSVGQIVVNL